MALRSGSRRLAQEVSQLFSWRRPSAGGAWRQLQASAARSEPPSGSLPANQRQLPQQAQPQQAKQQQQQQRASGGAQCGAGNGGGSGPAPPANPQVREQLRRQQQYAGAQKQAAPSASPPQLAQQQAVPASAAPASQQPADSRGLLAPAVEELFARVQGDKGLQERLRLSTGKPSVFHEQFVGNRLEQFARMHGIDQSMVFRAIRAAKQQQAQQGGAGPGASREAELDAVLAQLRAAAEEWAAAREAKTGSLVQPPQPPAVTAAATAAVQVAEAVAAATANSPPLQQPATQQPVAAGAFAAAVPPGVQTGAAPPQQQGTQPAGDPALGAASPGGAAVDTAGGSQLGEQGPEAGGAAGAPAPRASVRDLLNSRGIMLPQYSPGTYNHLLCPACKGGPKREKSLSVTIDSESKSGVWNCFRTKCGATGSVHVGRGADFVNDSGFFVTPMRKRKEEPPVRPNPALLEPPSGEVLEFLLSRGLSPETLEAAGVAQQRLFVPANQREETVIAFPYHRDGQLVNVKYRTLDKKFWQVKGAEKVLYGLDDIAPGATDVVIVEGEVDKLSLMEAGIKAVVSVPDGAPARVREGDLPPESEDTKFSYLWACRAWLDQASKVIIATDNDAPGDALAEELARRLGRERCWRVQWPFNKADHEYIAAMAGLTVPDQPGIGGGSSSNGAALAEEEAPAAEAEGQQPAQGEEGAAEGDVASELAAQLAASAGSEEEGGAGALPAPEPVRIQEEWYRKDANEVLLKDGPAMLAAFIQNAEPLPIRGLFRFHEFYEDIIKHYYLQLRDAQGVSTGWPTLDAMYKVVPGELTIVTGVPNSGKSEWIDALLCNLTDQHGWAFAMCSMEKRATDHARHLVEKCVGKPFFDLPYARGVPRMTQGELDAGLDWVDDRFHLIRYEDDNLPSIEWVLDKAKAAVYRYGIRGLVIDPYNELDHQRPAAMTETEYVSQMLGKIKRFAQTCGVHVWFVAHPRQLREWKGQPPNLYDISGSAHFINKADNGIVVHRNRDPDAPNTFEVQILVRKVRNKAAGTIGDCVLEYDRVTGRYIDPEQEQYSARTSRRVDYGALRQAAQRSGANGSSAGSEGGAGTSSGGEGGAGFGSSWGGGAGGGVWISPQGTLESTPVGEDGFE